jgi:hypothetical protein
MRGQDVDDFVNSTPTEKFDELVAMDRIVPFGDEKLCLVMATGFSLVIDRLNRLIRAWSGEDNPQVQPKDLLPWKTTKPKKKRPEYVSPNAAAAAFKLAVNR